MKKEQTILERFSKPGHFFNKGGKPSIAGLREAFQNYHLDDLRQELGLWRDMALANENSAYDCGNAREDLIDFVHGTQILIEAFYVLYQKDMGDTKQNILKGLSRRSRKIIAGMSKPVLLTASQNAAPAMVVHRFCRKFPHLYAKAEQLDLLEAVITYVGDKKIYKGNLVLFYRHIDFFLRLAYSLCGKKKS